MAGEPSTRRRRTTLAGLAIVGTVMLAGGALWVDTPGDYYFGVLLGMLVASLAWWAHR